MRLLTTDQLCGLLHVSRSTVYGWVRQGRLKPHRFGRAILFQEDEVMGRLGQLPAIPVWLSELPLASGRQLVLSGAEPSYWVEPVDRLSPDVIVVRVTADGRGEQVSAEFSGLPYRALCDARDRKTPLFVGSHVSVWHVHDVRREERLGESCLVVELERCATAAGEEALEQRVAKLKEGMADSRIREVTPWRREELYERRTS